MYYGKAWSALDNGHADPQTAKTRKDNQDSLARRVQEIRDYGARGFDVLPEPQSEEDGGLHAEYLKAFQANAVAQRRCAEAMQRIQEVKADADGNATARNAASGRASSTSVLQRHLKLLRLQKQHGELVCLRDEIEALKLARGLSSLRIAVDADADTDVPGVVASQPVGDDTGGTIPRLEGLVENLMKGMEIAVVQAQREAGRQATALDGLKAQSRPFSTHTAQQQVSALSSTRSELTAWLEESLEKCQDDIDGDPRCVEHASGQRVAFDEVEMEQKTDEEYERYLEARKRLLLAVSALKTEVSGAGLQAEGHESEAGARDMDTNTRPPRLAETHMVGSIEKRLLPAMQQHNITQHHLGLAEEQLRTETESIVKVIERLSDESQLLQAYPMLAHSGRFQHASSVLGSKPRDENVEQDRIAQLIEPWLFSAEAADVAAASGIEKHLKQGKEAIGSVARRMTELGLLIEASHENSTFDQ
ncbi:uncharacterized protein A1O9_05227 [Exophiala aquamarina CBS 119918]|uniref:Uncharacterized protein n=1 Tax=Exophiala aquamarina CBS 119918 TaxID=1182545 RepID=A0A072PPA4_9EURO|nr:uncharacterized protein A1O9_05227 [Exophiala aquamarina CBS 119918]KEF57310.1 hypothetical protein A1O9_05227 [Exophiala aquamarina CBS 119918]